MYMTKRESMKKIKLLCLLILWSLIGTAALGADWTKKRLTDNGWDDRYPDIAVNGGYVYTIWDSTTGSSEIWFRRSTDGGATWLPRKTLAHFSLDYAFFQPAIAADGSNVSGVWVRQDDLGNNEIFFRTSNDNGATWQASKRLTYNSGSSKDPAIVRSGATVCVVWSDDTPGNYEIYFRKSIDGGETWQAAHRLTSNSGASTYPAIAANGEKIYVVWVDNTSGNNDIFFRKSTDGGATWNAAKQLTTSASDSHHPRIALNGSNIYATWCDDVTGNYEIYFRRSLDSGASWQTSKNITNNAGSSGSPDIAVRGDSVFLAWDDTDPGNYEIYFCRSDNGGVSWQASQRLMYNSGYSGCPAIAVSSSKIFVTWMDNLSWDKEIFVSFSPL